MRGVESIAVIEIAWAKVEVPKVCEILGRSIGHHVWHVICDGNVLGLRLNFFHIFFLFLLLLLVCLNLLFKQHFLGATRI